MSDEEKKALERIDYIQDFIIENGQYNADVNDMEYFSKVLNLIEKQLKEIEELNLENIELKQSKIVDKNSIPNQYNFYDCYNFIHKDKIKAKIEEIKDGTYDAKIVLQLLLEEE